MAKEPSHAHERSQNSGFVRGKRDTGRTISTSHRVFATSEMHSCRPANTAWHDSRTNEVCSIREEILGANHSDVGDDLDRIARVLTLLERYDEALAASDRALQIKENALPRGDVRIARTLETRALLLQRRGDYPRAGLDLDRAWAIRELGNPNHPEAAGTLSLKGVQRRVEGDFIQAKDFSSRALALAQKSLRQDHPDIATYIRLLAIPVESLGDLREARILRERALAIAKTSLGADHLAVAVHLNDLANSLYAEGEYAPARTLFEEALRIYERNLGPDHSGVTTAVYNLAVVSSSLGDFRRGPSPVRSSHLDMVACRRP